MAGWTTRRTGPYACASLNADLHGSIMTASGEAKRALQTRNPLVLWWRRGEIRCLSGSPCSWPVSSTT